MNFFKNKYSCFIFLIILSSLLLKTQAKSQPQFLIGIKFMGLAFHPKKSSHPQLYKNRLDNNGHFVITKGIAVTFDYNITNELNLRLSQAFLFGDCANQNAGMTQLGVNAIYPIIDDKHLLSACFGPMLFYRKNWNGLPGYVDENLFKHTKNYKTQYKFVWYGVHGDYNFAINNREYLSISVLPGIPELIAIAPGIIYKSKKVENKL